MPRILYIKSFSGTGHEKVLQEYQDFFNWVAGEPIGDHRTEFLISQAANSICPVLTIIFRAYEPG